MRARELLLAAVGFFTTAVVMTWPLAADMTGSLPHDPRFEPFTGSDMNTWVWNFWWARRVVEEGRPPFFCDQIFLPFGHSLALHTHTFLWGLLSVPLQWVGGLFFAVNAMVLLLLAAAATAAYALGREVGLRAPGAALMGFAFGFSPYFLQKGLVHFNLGASPWMPLALVFLLRWMRAPDRSLSSALGLGLVVGLSLLTGSLQSVYLAFALLLVVLVAPHSGEARPLRRVQLLRPVSILLCLGMAGITAAPLLLEWWPEWRSMRDFGDFPQEFHPRLVDFFTPSGLHPMFPGLGAGASVHGAPFELPRPEHAALYLRLSLLSLAAVGLFRAPRSRRWGALFLVLFVLAWDPGPEPQGWLASLYRNVPPLGLLRVPARLLPAATLCLGLVAGHGLEALTTRRRGARVAVVLACGLVFESWSAPYPSARVEIPRAVRELESVPRGGVVLKLPHQSGASVSMLWQTQHGLPAALSYVARINPHRIETLRTIAPDLSVLTEAPQRFLLDPENAPTMAAIAVDLRRLGIRHLLVHEAAMADPRELYILLDELEGWEQAPAAGDGVTRWYATGF